MTFEELVKGVAKEFGVPNYKAEAVIRTALERSAKAALKGERAPLFPGIGRFVAVAVRSTGRKPDGTQWAAPGRTKLGLNASIHSGGVRKHKPQSIRTIGESAA